MKLTAKQEKFAQEWYATGNKSEAYRRAYNASNMSEVVINNEASLVSQRAGVISYYEELRKREIEDGSVRLPVELIDAAINHFGSIEEAKKHIQSAAIASLVELGVNPSGIAGRSRSISENNRYFVLNRAGFKCQACGVKPSASNDVALHIDHATPFSWGGTNDTDNLQVLCGCCNIAKSNFYDINHNEVN